MNENDGENEGEKDILNIKKEKEEVEIDKEESEKMTEADMKLKSKDDEQLEISNKEIVRFRPKIKLDMEHQRYPYCLVWTPLPCFTWIIPCIGHVGICNSQGIIHDFAGPYFVSIDDMAFGNPTKYVLLELDNREYDDYDNAIDEGTEDYKKMNYSFCFNNCHSFVARCLNRLKYKGKTNYTMIHVWWMFLCKGKFLNCCKFIQSYIGFFFILVLVITLSIIYS